MRKTCAEQAPRGRLAPRGTLATSPRTRAMTADRKRKPFSRDGVLRAAGIGHSHKLWRRTWLQSEVSFPGEHVPFLRRGYVEETCRLLRMAADTRQAFADALVMFIRIPELKRLAWHCHYLLFVSDKDHRETVLRAPLLPEDLCPGAPMFYALVYLSGVPAVLSRNRTRGIPDRVTLDTLADLETWVREYAAEHGGTWGFSNRPWIMGHFTGDLHKLGRLQFRFEIFPFDYHAMRHADTGRVCMLAGDGMRFREDGQFEGADGVPSPGAWSATYRAGVKGYVGHPVSADGAARPRPVTLLPDEWMPALEKGNPVLGLHIPATGPLLPGQCATAVRRAARFFPKHFPDYNFRAFTCVSWFLDNQFNDLLPHESNIRQFLRQLYLFPVPNAGDLQIFERVFGQYFTNIDDAPCHTRLQHTVVDHIRRGGRWRNGGGFILPADLPWGNDVYRSTCGSPLPGTAGASGRG